MRGKRQQQHPTVGHEFSRTFEQFVEWLSPRRGPSSTHISSQEELNAFRAETPYVRFLAYTTPEKEDVKWHALTTDNGLLDDFARAHVTFTDGKRKPGFVYVENGAGDEIASFDLKQDDFKQFAIKHGYSYGGELTDQHLRAQATTKVPLFVGIFKGTPTEEQLEPFRQASAAIAGKMLSGWSTDEEQAVKWGTSGSKFPTAVVVRGLGSHDTYFVPYDEDKETWDAQSLISYANKVDKDTYPRYIRSEPIPETQGAVTVLVGKTFEEIVLDETKDVFVEFYAPWCGHCKKLAPIWDELAEALKPLEDIVIAKIDATSNTLPRGINANSYPTIMWFPKNNKLPTVYSQTRTFDNFKRYVLTSATRRPIDLEKETAAWKLKQQELKTEVKTEL